MKLLIFKQNKKQKLGIHTDQGIIDVEETAKNTNHTHIETDIMDIIASTPADMKVMTNFVKQALNDHKAIFVSEEQITFEPSITRPGKIICVGLNYAKHADETGSSYPKSPILFSKFTNALTGHKSDVTIPRLTRKLDYEVELAIIIGKQARNVNQTEALDYVFGYSTANDLSARDLQFKTPQWLLGKTSDGFAPIGPYLVTADAIKNPNELTLKTYVNGVLKQDSNTSDMIFSCEDLISYISQVITLEPGDVILTGTPEGVVMGRPEDQQTFIQPGDEVTVEVEQLGALTNYFIDE